MKQTAPNMTDGEKIWRYMDLAKFFSLLSKKALFFPSPKKFSDPYEGYAYRDLFIDGVFKLNERLEKLENMKHTASTIASSVTLDHPDFGYDKAKYESAIRCCDEGIEEIAKGFTDDIEKIRLDNGVSCWHKSEHESEAMWKLYTNTGQGIAIESTIEQLENSIISDRKIIFVSVIYVAEDEQNNTEHLE